MPTRPSEGCSPTSAALQDKMTSPDLAGHKIKAIINFYFNCCFKHSHGLSARLWPPANLRCCSSGGLLVVSQTNRLTSRMLSVQPVPIVTVFVFRVLTNICIQPKGVSVDRSHCSSLTMRSRYVEYKIIEFMVFSTD